MRNLGLLLAVGLAACTGPGEDPANDAGEDMADASLQNGDAELTDRGGNAPPEDPLSKLETVPDDARITLQRLGCFFCCPVYTVTVDAQGLVEFEGVRYVPTTGTATQEVPSPQVLDLLHQAGEIGFSSIELDDGERDGVDADADTACGTDAETVSVTIHADGQENTVRRYGGCDAVGVRGDVEELEDAIVNRLVRDEWLEGDVECDF